jgi:hypothetical protein
LGDGRCFCTGGNCGLHIHVDPCLRGPLPFAREFPRGCVTFGDLTKLVLAHNYGRIAAKDGRWSENELMQALLHFVAAEAAIDLNKLSSDTSFPEGLGIY